MHIVPQLRDRQLHHLHNYYGDSTAEEHVRKTMMHVDVYCEHVDGNFFDFVVGVDCFCNSSAVNRCLMSPLLMDFLSLLPVYGGNFILL